MMQIGTLRFLVALRAERAAQSCDNSPNIYHNRLYFLLEDSSLMIGGITMTPLRKRMMEDMQLHGFSKGTQEVYVSAIRRMAEHYGKSPDRITEEELRQYFLYLTNEKQASRSTCTILICAVKFLYERTLQREWPTLTLYQS